MADDQCLNCGQRIRLINFALGAEWMHVDPAASFPTEYKGTAWKYCRISVAAPVTAPPGGGSG